MKTFPHLIFISGYNNKTGEDNTPKLKKQLEELFSNNITNVTGSYKHTTENTLMIESTNINSLLHIANDYNQESILVVDSNRNASIHNTVDGKCSFLGKFGQITKKKALKEGNYTLCNGYFYGIK